MNIKPIKHSHLFKSIIEKKVYHKIGSPIYKEPWVDHVKGTSNVGYNLKDKEFSTEYLTFTAEEDGTFTFTIPQDFDEEAVAWVSYSTDNGTTWVKTENTGELVTITTPTVRMGDTVLWKGDALFYGGRNPRTGAFSGSTFSSTGKFYATGNIMSLLFSDDFDGESAFSGDEVGCFIRLFADAVGLTSASKIILPSPTLTQYCYSLMFYGCTSLVSAPELPATTLAENCYAEMFEGCSSLNEAPLLPSATLAGACYAGMFQGCTSLMSAPALPATALVDGCYSNMFNGCSGLNYIKAMFTTTPSELYTSSWVEDVSESGVFVKNSAAQWDVTGIDGVPTGWTVETASE